MFDVKVIHIFLRFYNFFFIVEIYIISMNCKIGITLNTPKMHYCTSIWTTNTHKIVFQSHVALNRVRNQISKIKFISNIKSSTKLISVSFFKGLSENPRNTVNSVIEAHISIILWTLKAVLHSRFCQFFQNKCSNFTILPVSIKAYYNLFHIWMR